MPYLEVNLPNNERERIEINSNSLMVHVLEEVCASRGLDYTNFTLQHGKKDLDLSSKFSMTNLINETRIHLIEYFNSLPNDKIDVSFHLQNNQRISVSADIRSPLWNILVEANKKTGSIFPPKNSNQHIALIQMHIQVVGEFALKNTTLISLGIRNKILFRLVHKEVSKEEIEDINNALIKRKQYIQSKKEQFKRTLAYEPQTQTQNMDWSSPSTVGPQSEMYPVQHPKFEEEKNPLSPFYVPNVDRNPTNPPVRNDSKTLGEVLGVRLELENANPFFVNKDQPDFSNFKFPTEEVNSGSEVRDDHITNDDDVNMLQFEDRDAVFFKRVSETVHEEDELSDSFFELTENELRKMIQDCQNIAQSEKPLMTKALRDEQKRQRYSKYKHCIIQFHFTDSYILQVVFNPLERVGDLYDYVARFFDQKQRKNFQLYTSPPKVFLNDTKSSLIDSDLVPMTKVYVSKSAQSLFSGDIERLAAGANRERANEIIRKWMKPETVKSKGEILNNTTTTTTATSGENKVSSSDGQTSSTKVPRWFRTGKK